MLNSIKKLIIVSLSLIMGVITVALIGAFSTVMLTGEAPLLIYANVIFGALTVLIILFTLAALLACVELHKG